MAHVVCTEVTGSDSPILPLESVLGFEVERSRLDDRAMKGSGETKLVQERAKAAISPLVMPWDPAYARFGYVRVKGISGDFLAGQTVKPKSPDLPPAVILLDEEIRYFTPRGALREDQDGDEAAGIALGGFPLGSHLIANGFAVLFPSRDVLEKKGRFQGMDWYELIEKWVKRDKVDRESLFLVATHENAQLALALASEIRFAGVVIEAPRRLIFRDSKKEREQAEKDASASEVGEGVVDLGVFESQGQLNRYFAVVKSQKAPVQLIASREEIRDEMLRKSLLLAFSLTGADLRVTALDGVARRLLEEGESAQETRDVGADYEDRQAALAGVHPAGPSFRPRLAFEYEAQAFDKWVGRMIHFMVQRSQNEPLRIPAPQRERRSREGAMPSFSGSSDFGNEEDRGSAGGASEGGDGESGGQ